MFDKFTYKLKQKTFSSSNIVYRKPYEIRETGADVDKPGYSTLLFSTSGSLTCNGWLVRLWKRDHWTYMFETPNGVIKTMLAS